MRSVLLELPDTEVVSCASIYISEHAQTRVRHAALRRYCCSMHQMITVLLLVTGHTLERPQSMPDSSSVPVVASKSGCAPSRSGMNMTLVAGYGCWNSSCGSDVNLHVASSTACHTHICLAFGALIVANASDAAVYRPHWSIQSTRDEEHRHPIHSREQRDEPSALKTCSICMVAIILVCGNARVITSTWLLRSSRKLPTANRNFLSRRFCAETHTIGITAECQADTCWW